MCAWGHFRDTSHAVRRSRSVRIALAALPKADSAAGSGSALKSEFLTAPQAASALYVPDQPLRPASLALMQANRQEIDADLPAECDRRNPPPSTSLNP